MWRPQATDAPGLEDQRLLIWQVKMNIEIGRYLQVRGLITIDV